MDDYKQLISLRIFPTGRRLFALKGTANVAGPLNDTVLIGRITLAIEGDSRCLQLERGWHSQNFRSAARGLSVVLDPKVDHLLTAVVSTVQNVTKALDETHSLATVAREFEDTWFPGGAKAITSLPFEEQLEETEALVQVFTGEEMAPTIAKLGLSLFVNELVQILPKYREEIEKLPPKNIKYVDVVAARSAGHQALLRVVARILGTFDLDSDAKVRGQLLAPIFDQNARLIEASRLGKKSKDIDPDTGVELGTTTTD